MFDGIQLIGGMVGRLVSPEILARFGNHGNYITFTGLQVVPLFTENKCNMFQIKACFPLDIGLSLFTTLRKGILVKPNTYEMTNPLNLFFYILP